MAISIAADDCVACGACVDACPLGAITVDDVATVDADTCCECGACIPECAVDAISL